MAGIGEFLGKGLNSLYGNDANGDPTRAGMWAQTVGAGYDYYEAQKKAKQDRLDYEDALARQQAITNQQLQLAQRRAAEEQSLRGGIVNRSQMLEQAINQARLAMGELPAVTQNDINQNYQQIRGMYQDDLNETIDRVSSQGFAKAISQGMDRSDRFRDEERDLSRTYASELRKMDQEAYNAAINRVGTNQQTLMDGRKNVYADIGSGYQTGIDNLRDVMPTNAGSAYSNASTSAGDYRSEVGETAEDSMAGEGTARANLGKYGGNMDFLLGKGDYDNPNNTKIAEQQQTINDLQARIDRLGLSNGNK